MYTITKTFTFCYGHRLICDKGKCGRLHGHTARVDIKIASEKLGDDGMVMHFDHLKETIGDWIHKNLDHKLILNRDDPAAKALTDIGEDILTVAYDPTAENLARMIFEHAAKSDIPINKISFWESETAKATYRPNE